MILDTKALSAWWTGEPAAAALLATARTLFVPVPAIVEFRYGVLQSHLRDPLTRWMEEALGATTILGIDSDTARHCAEIRLALRQSGTPIPTNDLWIAALARQHHLPVASRDAHFDHVKDITRVAW